MFLKKENVKPFSNIHKKISKDGHLLAIDFETANSSRNSVCAVGVALIEEENITSASLLCCPPVLDFDGYNIAIHGITEKDVRNKPKFDVIWKEHFLPIVEGSVLVAHNASFDISVLRKTLDYYKIPYPDLSYICTYRIAKKVWPELKKHKLNVVCKKLNIKLNHHDAESDAYACAKILAHAYEEVGASDIYTLMKKINLNIGKLYTDGYTPCGILEGGTNLDARAIEAKNCDFDEEHIFFQKNFVFTGEFKSMCRRDAMQILSNVGGKPQNGVNKKTDFLVLGEDEYENFLSGGGTGKIKRANQLIGLGQSIDIISEKVFLTHVNN